MLCYTASKGRRSRCLAIISKLVSNADIGSAGHDVHACGCCCCSSCCGWHGQATRRQETGNSIDWTPLLSCGIAMCLPLVVARVAGEKNAAKSRRQRWKYTLFRKRALSFAAMLVWAQCKLFPPLCEIPLRSKRPPPTLRLLDIRIWLSFHGALFIVFISSTIRMMN